MYGTFWNTVYVALHYAFAVLVLFVWMPKRMFGLPEGPERGMAAFTRVVFFYIVLAYGLVLTKLFEVMAILAVILLYASRRYLRKTAASARNNLFTMIGLTFYELLDLGIRWKKAAKTLLKKNTASLRASFTQRSPGDWLFAACFAAVFLCAGYVRLKYAVLEAAPSMSDGYVTLAWMKYIEQRVLFHDGIYPEGFHMILAYLHKFAAVDQIYILNWTGPLVGVMITFSAYWTTARFTNNRWAGLVAAVAYGVGGTSLQGADWERQAATNSQEFALIFLFPSLYFFAKYIAEGKRDDLLTGGAGLSIQGFVHTLVFAYGGMSLAVAMFVGLVMRARPFLKRLWPMTITGVVSIVCAVVPFGIGKLLGREVHGSSENFLLEKTQVSPPDLRLWDELALAGLAVLVLGWLLRRKPFREKIPDLVAILFIAASFVMYEWAPSVTQSMVLASRVNIFWGLTIPVALGMGVHCLFLWVKWNPVRATLQGTAAGVLFSYCFVTTQFAAIHPYKMEWNAGVEQYLKISSEFRPHTWTIVSQSEGYSEVLGNGYHVYLADFLKNYDPSLPPITHVGWTEPDPNLSPDIFVYHEKQVFEVSKTNGIYTLLEKGYASRKEENQEFEAWLAKYTAANGKPDVYYEDQHLIIYRFHKAETEEEKQQKVWGKTEE
ncbi:hypothetical protein [Tumebacillus flagellatus]|uniref:Glycosyltransferase RgtA/B/C/D-like domain-containing protein n=1 Tax=Tumebacillus flagellatus TaxID=1157490 RepID=A0A074LK29_9BACL|nr:hypothetical protein [Tumebacillus flagellatus]KEO81464.1 hypothetical protein EL26_20525 [Tumebacillus flagellatus]